MSAIDFKLGNIEMFIEKASGIFDSMEEAYQDMMRELNAVCNGLKNALRAVEKDIHTAYQEIEHISAVIAGNEKKIAEFESRVRSLESGIRNKQQQISSLRSQGLQAQNQDEVNLIKSQINTINVAIKHDKHEIGALNQEIANIKHDNVTLRSIGNQIQSELSSLKAFHERVGAKLSVLLDENDVLRHTYEGIAHQSSSLMKKMGESEQCAEQLLKTLEQLPNIRNGNVMIGDDVSAEPITFGDLASLFHNRQSELSDDVRRAKEKSEKITNMMSDPVTNDACIQVSMLNQKLNEFIDFCAECSSVFGQAQRYASQYLNSARI